MSQTPPPTNRQEWQQRVRQDEHTLNRIQQNMIQNANQPERPTGLPTPPTTPPPPFVPRPRSPDRDQGRG
jgi:hypothetical protein